jgi:outer membrane protein assembly factor BamB
MALQVASTDGRLRWIVYYFAPEKMARYSVAGWSADGGYLYVAYRFGYRDGPGHAGTSGILRLDLRDGALAPFLSFGDLDEYYWPYAFSTPGDFFAYIPPGSQQQLIVINLTTGKKLSAALDPFFSSAGELTWSPDRKQLLLVNSRYDDQGGGLIGIKQTDALFWVKLLDDHLEITEVARFDGTIFIQDWNGDRVMVSRYNFGAAKGLAYVHLSSQITVPITKTPTPRPKP